MEFLFDKEFSLEIRTALVRSMISLLHLCGAYELRTKHETTDNNFQIKSSVCTALQARSQSKRGVSIYCRNFEFCFCIHRIVCDEPSICWTRRDCVYVCCAASVRQKSMIAKLVFGCSVCRSCAGECSCSVCMPQAAIYRCIIALFASCFCINAATTGTCTRVVLAVIVWVHWRENYT